MPRAKVSLEECFSGLVAHFGLTVVKSAGTTERPASGHRTPLTDHTRWAPSPQWVLRLLKTYRPNVLGHDDFVRHMAAIKIALGPNRQDYYPDVLAWAPGERHAEEDATRKVWDSITDAEVDWQWLVRMSGMGAEFDFEDAASMDPSTDSSGFAPDPISAALQKTLDRYVFDEANGSFYDERTGASISKDTFNAKSINLAPYGSVGRKSAAAIFLNSREARKAVTTTYRPGTASFIDLEYNNVTVKAINRWRPSALVPIRGKEPALWLDHMRMLLPDDGARDRVLDWMAFILQNPGVKIGYAILILSTIHGVGKDTALVPLLRGLGAHNYVKITPQILLGRWNSYLNNQLVVVPEMANFEKGQIELILKHFLAIEETLPQIEEKGRELYTGFGNQNLIIFSNYGNAVKLDDEDRRVDVHKSPMLRQPPEYFHRIWNWYDSGGDAIVCGWLMARDLSHFDRAAPPPMTQAKLDMIEATMPAPVRWVNDHFREEGRFHYRQFMTAREIRDAACEFGSSIMMQHMHQGHIERALRKNGFAAISGRHRVDDTMVTIWTRDPRCLKLSGQFLVAKLKADRIKRPPAATAAEEW